MTDCPVAVFVAPESGWYEFTTRLELEILEWAPWRPPRRLKMQRRRHGPRRGR